MKLLTTICTTLLICLSTQAQTSRLDSIFAPRVIGIPPSDAYIGLSKLENGEIRHYNYGEQSPDKAFYIRSVDSGFTWTKVPTHGMPFADNRNPLSGEYLRLTNYGSMGIYAIRTEGGIYGGRQLIKVTDKPYIMLKPPVFIRGGKRVLVCAHSGNRGDSEKGCLTLYSDDDGFTWHESNKINTPNHTGGGFHKGIRWNHGAVEPTVIELADGRVWMLIRTSLDNLYQSFSDDGGQTWQTPTESPFYSTITMPTIGRLSDGRMLLLWCNTTPLPELETANGVWDDVFTNRNAIHAAISEDDGKTWIGMRELYLDPRRNAADFGSTPGMDKSVHQSQFVEVADNKILVSLGQNVLHRKMVMFDLAWLYEKSCYSDFSNGLADWSAFKYYKGIQGHCGYNRMEGDILFPHTGDPSRNMIKIRYMPSDTLVADNDGAVWNFPVMPDGCFSTSFRINKGAKNITMLLGDRWFNPTDTVVKYYAMYDIDINPRSLGVTEGGWHTLTVEWDTTDKDPSAILSVDGKRLKKRIPLKNKTMHGLSYVHFISGNTPDPSGVDIEWVKAEKLK